MSNPIKREWTSEDGRIRLIQGDCLEVMPLLGKVDAVITDPPYGISLPTNYAKTRRVAESLDSRRHAWACKEHAESMHGDSLPFDPTPFLRFKTAVMWGANNYADRLPARYSWLAWDKRDNRGANCNFGDCELAWCDGVPFNSVRMFHHLWIGYQRDSEVGEGSIHPTQKPVALMSWCMDIAKIPQDATVADFFMGSGTTGIACIRTGRRFIGVEIDPHYFDVALDRIIRELAQPRLPMPEPEPQPKQIEMF